MSLLQENSKKCPFPINIIFLHNDAELGACDNVPDNTAFSQKDFELS